MKRAITALVVLGWMAAPGLAVVVQLENFENPYNSQANGPVADPWVSIGYGPPATWNSTDDNRVDHVPPGGDLAQVYAVPGSAFDVNPGGSGNLYHPAYSNGDIAPGGSTDFLQMVLDAGGPAPSAGAFRVTADIKITADNPGDYERLSIDTVFAGGFESEYLGGGDAASNNAVGNVASLPGLGGDGSLTNGQWFDDYPLVTCDTFITRMLFFPGFNFTITNPFAGNAWFIMDDLAVEYVPEPTTLALFGLAGLMLRRRR